MVSESIACLDSNVTMSLLLDLHCSLLIESAASKLACYISAHELARVL